MPSLIQQAELIRSTIDRALVLIAVLPSLEGISRLYVAEMIIIRVFSLFEAVVEDSACKLVCGASYCDGMLPALQRERPTRGYERARIAMCTFGRTDARNRLRWSKAGEIGRNLEYLFPQNEHFVDTLRGHGRFISDLRKVRNHIAHGNRGTRIKFNGVVRNYYGADINSMTPGRMLLSSRFTPILVEEFCRTTQVILLTAIRA